MRNGKPKYEVAVDFIKDKIASGEWKPGHQLPSQTQWRDGEPGLKVQYGTLRGAYLVLKAERLIEGRQGEGVYVTDPKARNA